MVGEGQLQVLGIDCSPTGPGRTGNVLEEVLGAAADAGAETSLMHLGGEAAVSVPDAVPRMTAADAFVFGSPIYRATFATPFKALVDATPRGMWGETEAPLTGRAVAIVATGASAHHFLGLRGMRDLLVEFFAAQVVSPGLYVEQADFAADRTLLAPVAERARLQGTALIELATAIAAGGALGSVEPQV
jgi:FMN reductase